MPAENNKSSQPAAIPVICGQKISVDFGQRKAVITIRLKIESYMYDNKKITMLSNNFYDFYLPFGCGYTIEQQFLSDDEMALAMLSQDKNYDIYFVNSAQSISENIKNKGAFYPLNEVEGVQKYLDACFSYIRDAATNSDGDIWMLPISVDIPVIFTTKKHAKNTV